MVFQDVDMQLGDIAQFGRFGAKHDLDDSVPKALRLFRSKLVWSDRPSHAALPEDSDSISHLYGFMEHVSDKHDRQAAGFKSLEHLSEFGYTCRSQHRCRLVQDESGLTFPQGLDDLDDLLFIQSKVSGDCVRIDVSSQDAREFIEAPASLGLVECRSFGIPQDEVFEHSEGWHQSRMLIHGSDT